MPSITNTKSGVCPLTDTIVAPVTVSVLTQREKLRPATEKNVKHHFKKKLLMTHNKL